MRRKLFASAVVLCIFLSSCSSGNKADNSAQKIHEEFLSSENIYAVLTLTADYGDKVYDFKLSCDFSNNTGTIKITEPESIAGTEIRVSSDRSTLVYDGAEVYTGEIMPDGISPVDAVPVMLSCWCDGLITESVSEKYDGNDCIAIRYRVDDNTSLNTWFDEKTHLPLHAEFMYDGHTVILCDFENVKVE